MAEHTDPAIDGTRGAFAFVAAEWSDDDLRIGAQQIAELEASPAWQTLMAMVAKRRELVVNTIIHSPPTTPAAEFAAVGGQAEALDWLRFAPQVLRTFAKERDEANRQALERAGQE